MKEILKSATLVLATKKSATIILAVKTADGKLIERRVKWDKSSDFWTAIKIGKVVLDVNVYDLEGNGKIKCAIYPTKLKPVIRPTKQIEEFLETDTSVWSSKVVKTIPFAEYEAMKK